MKKVIMFIICSLTLVSCDSQETKVKYYIEKDSINYAFPFNNLKTWGIYEYNKDIFLFAKFSKSDTIYIFKEGKNGFNLFKDVPLPKVYLDTIGSEIQSDRFQIAFIDLNNIIIVTRYSLAMIDIKNSKLVKYYYQSYDKYALVDRFGVIKWNQYRNKLPMMLVRFDNHSERKWAWDSQLLAEFDFKTGKINILPIVYPFVEQYRSKGMNYSYADPLITFNKNKYVVAFGNNPIIFTYDVKTEKKDSFYIEIINYKPVTIITDSIVEQDFNLYQDYVMSAYTNDFFYTEIIYDEYYHVYYRFFYKDMPKYDENGLVNTFNKKDIGLTILDRILKLLEILYGRRKMHIHRFGILHQMVLYGITSNCIGSVCKKDHLTVLKLKLEYEK